MIHPDAIRPIQELKIKYLGSKNPRLHTDETLIALSVSAASNPEAGLALEQLPKLKRCQAHTSVMLSSVDIWEFRKLGIELTCEKKIKKKKSDHDDKSMSVREGFCFLLPTDDPENKRQRMCCAAFLSASESG